MPHVLLGFECLVHHGKFPSFCIRLIPARREKHKTESPDFHNVSNDEREQNASQIALIP